MNREEIIRMAWDSGMSVARGSPFIPLLERFAALAAAAEREACAKVAEANGADEPYGHAKFRCHNIAEEIRARGQA